MLIRRYSLCYITALLFVVALWQGGMLCLDTCVSRGTVKTPAISYVQEGIVDSGQIVITQVSEVLGVPTRLKISNHSSTLRAFIAPGHFGSLALYVESVKPHKYFVISGRYTVSRDYYFSWQDVNTIQYFGKSSDGILYDIRLNVKTLALTQFPVLDKAEEGQIVAYHTSVQ